MVAVDPQSVPEHAQTVLLLLLKGLKVNRTALLCHKCLNRASHSVTGSPECQHRVNSPRHRAICSCLPRTCWCALIPIPGESSPAARCWTSTASLNAKPEELRLTLLCNEQNSYFRIICRHMDSSENRKQIYPAAPGPFKGNQRPWICPYQPLLQLLYTVWICCSSNGERKKVPFFNFRNHFLYILVFYFST